MWDTLRQIFLGVSRRPAVVAATRALLLYLIPLGVLWAIGYLNSLGPAYYGLTTLLSPLIRLVGEGLLDEIKKATQNDPRPIPPAGASEPGDLRDLASVPPRSGGIT